MKLKSLVISILIGLLLANAALHTANAQYASPTATGGDQIFVNQAYDAAQPANIMPQAGMMAGASAANAANFAQQPYSYAEPYAAANMPYASPYGMGPAGVAPLAAPCAAPLAAVPCADACGPYTSGFTYSAQQSSSFGPFSPPVAQASEQFYQYPGLTPFGAYPGAGYAAAGGVGLDPATGYYGPYGAVTPLI
jgi:hypothetical protein